MEDPLIVLTDNGSLEHTWPYVAERFKNRLSDRCKVLHLDLRKMTLDQFNWEDVSGVALFGGEFNEMLIERSVNLKVVGGITDGQGIDAISLLWERKIPFIDVTRAWGQSVAETGFCLILCALRRIPQWHHKLANGEFDWKYPHGQFCDDPQFVNGELAGKRIGVIGLGQIGSRIGQWCRMFGADVSGYDPHLPQNRFSQLGITSSGLDELVKKSEILVVAVPPVPGSEKMIDHRRIDMLGKGSIVMTITRTYAVDIAALRDRVLKDELVWASDVFDVEPLPNYDPILGRNNVVHIPHIGGRTKDANLRVADLLAEDFLNVLAGKPVACELTPAAVAIRTGNQS